MSRGRASLLVDISSFSPIVHTRCLINCLSHLGVASFASFGPSAPLGDSEVDECLKHSDYTRVSLAFSCCFGIIYIVLGVRSLI